MNQRDLARTHKGCVVKGYFLGSDNEATVEPHFAIVLNDKSDIARRGNVAIVAGISTDDKAPHPEDLIPFVGYGTTEPCFVHCHWIRELHLDRPTSILIWPPIPGDIVDKIMKAAERAFLRDKSTRQ